MLCRSIACLLASVALVGCGFDPSTNINPDARPLPPDAFVQPLAHCQAILEAGKSVGDGSYQIDPDGEGGLSSFYTHCDMTTDGGGWTLVYAYTFTDYGNYTSGGNAITPRPSWTIGGNTSVPISTTPPSTLDDFNAMEFARWKEVGSSILVRSNINHWLVCAEIDGSFVNQISGNIDCKINKVVGTACTTEVPTRFSTNAGGRGPSMDLNSFYYYWDGTTDGNWPTHDPCGQNKSNQLKGVLNPSGAILVRP